jgi:signal transduction histidine kinase
LINQMRFLARDELPAKQAIPLGPLVEEAFQEAQKHQASRSSKLQLDSLKQPVIVDGDRSALKHALAEILLNAIQANPADAKVDVQATFNPSTDGNSRVVIEVRDNGTGFSAEAAQRAAEPFFTTRNVGLGLGLTVCRRIVELHQGRLEFQAPQPGQPGIVRISLPSSPA